MQKALQYAQIAKAAYSTAPTYGAENSAARAIVSSTDDGEIISFPGTNNIASWLADLNIDTTNVIGLGTLHEGFWNAFSSIRGPLREHSPAVTCGHSEGAALALIYAGERCIAGTPPKAVYAFEPPRIATDTVLIDLLLKHGVELYIFRNGNDIVPEIPRLIRDWKAYTTMKSIGVASEPFVNVTDHLIDNVIASIAAMVDTQPRISQLRD